VERHVPSWVRVEVLDLMSDLESLDVDSAPDDAAGTDATTEAGR